MGGWRRGGGLTGIGSRGGGGKVVVAFSLVDSWFCVEWGRE